MGDAASPIRTTLSAQGLLRNPYFKIRTVGRYKDDHISCYLRPIIRGLSIDSCVIIRRGLVKVNSRWIDIFDSSLLPALRERVPEVGVQTVLNPESEIKLQGKFQIDNPLDAFKD